MLEYHRFKTVHDLYMKGRGDEARQQLAGLQRRYVALCDENTTLKMQVQEYEDILYLARNLAFDGWFYWLTTGSIKQGPFCPTCYNRDGLLMRLSGEAHERFCSSCREVYHKPVELAAAMNQEFPPLSGPASEAPGEALMPPPAALKRAKVIPFAR